MNRWFLVYCKPCQEEKAEENLLRQGYEVFRPTVNIEKIKSGRKVVIKNESLFPRYIFLNIDPEIKSISPVLSTYGVSNFVKFGDRYATATDSLITKIKTNIAKRISINDHDAYFQKGESIIVDGYGFDNINAVYCSPSGKDRAVILMNILGKESRLMVPFGCLSKAAC